MSEEQKKVRKCVVVLATDAHDRVVLVRNRKRKFELPGGGVEEGEDVLAAAIREFYEETGQYLVAYPGGRVLRGTPKPGADYDSEIYVLRGRIYQFELTGSDALADEVDGVLLASKEAVKLLHACGALSDLDSRRVLLEWAGLTDGHAVASSFPVSDEGGGP